MTVSDIEIKYIKKGILIAGLDEAGRGCIAGPVVAAAVIFDDKLKDIEGIEDSKKLTKKKREAIYEKLAGSGLFFSTGIVNNKKIDEINILQATYLAMRLAVQGLQKKPERLLVDGNSFKSFGIPYDTVIGGDAICLSVAAASIIAKVTRDWMMLKAHSEYPEYGFETNMGYGTKGHFRAIDVAGTCPLHRNSFLRKYRARQYSLFE